MEERVPAVIVFPQPGGPCSRNTKPRPFPWMKSSKSVVLLEWLFTTLWMVLLFSLSIWSLW